MIGLNESKLSRQQKAIIGYLHQNQDEDGPISIRKVSRHVAESFSKDHRDRIVNRDMYIAKRIESIEDPSLTPLATKMWMEKRRRMKVSTLTPAHRASVSRSIRRLRDRGIIEGFADRNFMSHSSRPRHRPSYRAEGCDRFFRLTERGREVAEIL